jgi:hypothetical protein
MFKFISRYNKKHYKFVKEISDEEKMDMRVVNFIVSHPFRFVADKMKDKEDVTPIRLRYIGAFCWMKWRKKE